MRSPQGLMRQAEQESKRNNTNYYDTLLQIIIAEHQMIQNAAKSDDGGVSVENKGIYNEQKDEFTKALQEVVAGSSEAEQNKFYMGMLTAVMKDFIKSKSANMSNHEFLRLSEWETIIKAPLGAYLQNTYANFGENKDALMKEFSLIALERVEIDKSQESQKAYKASFGEFINNKFTMFKNVLLSGSKLKANTVALVDPSLSSKSENHSDKFKKQEEKRANTISTPLDQPSSEQVKVEVLVQRLLAIQGQCEMLIEGVIRPNDPLDGIKLMAASTKLEQEQKKYLAILPKELHGQFNKIVKLQEEVIIQASGLSVNQATRETDIKNLSEAQQVLATEVNALKEGIDKIAKQESKTTTKKGKFAQAANRLSTTIEGWRH